MRDTRELIWASGLFEGEGCFYRHPKNNCFGVSVCSTDKDTIDRFAAAVQIPRAGISYRIPKNPKWKPSWDYRVSTFEGAQALMAMMWNGLGARRKAKATQLLKEYHERSYKSRKAVNG